MTEVVKSKSRNPAGRPTGTRNRNVVNARRAIADFVESNVPRFNEWLQRVAEGVPKVDRDGVPLRDNAGSIIYVVKPDALASLKTVIEICEYHLPKLSRQDVQVTGAVAHMDLGDLRPEDFAKMSLTELKALALDRFAQQAEAGNVIDVEATVVEPLPVWLEPLK